jgi:cell division topological specificity factor
MNIFSLFSRRRSAPVARDRLQILLAHERTVTGRVDLVGILREEILAVIGRHIPLAPERVRVRMERGDVLSTLEVEVDIPTQARVRIALAS